MTIEAAFRLREFTASLLRHEGALVEFLEPYGLDAMLPPSVQDRLSAPEYLRLGFTAESPPDAEHVSLESEWLSGFANLLDERGRQARVVPRVELPILGETERMVARRVVLHNAVYRVRGISSAWTRYLIAIVRYTAMSDEKREGLITLGVNTANESLIDSSIDESINGSTRSLQPTDQLLGRLLQGEFEPGNAPAQDQLPPSWSAGQLNAFVARGLSRRLRRKLNPFVQSMQRRLDRDLVRIFDYYTDLRTESLRRMRRRSVDSTREQLRIHAAAREYAAKVADLRQKISSADHRRTQSVASSRHSGVARRTRDQAAQARARGHSGLEPTAAPAWTRCRTNGASRRTMLAWSATTHSTWFRSMDTPHARNAASPIVGRAGSRAARSAPDAGDRPCEAHRNPARTPNPGSIP